MFLWEHIDFRKDYQTPGAYFFYLVFFVYQKTPNNGDIDLMGDHTDIT